MKTYILHTLFLATFVLLPVNGWADERENDQDPPAPTPGTPVVTAYYQAPNVHVTVVSNGTKINETGIYYRKNSSAASDLSGTRFYTETVVSDGTFTMNMAEKLDNDPGTYFFRAYAKYGTATHAFSDIMTFTLYDNSSGVKRTLFGQPINKDEIEFVAPVKGTVITKSLFLQIDNISSDVNLIIEQNVGLGAGTFTVTPTTISKEDLANGVTITVTFSGNVKKAGGKLTLVGNALDGLGHTTLNLKGSYVKEE